MRRALLLALGFAAACTGDRVPFDPVNPAQGPGGLVGNGAPVSDGLFGGDQTVDPAAAPNTPAPEAATPSCGAACQTHCAALALGNPVDAGVCGALWGVGLDTRPVEPLQACRRLFADFIGRFPTRGEAASRCEGRAIGEVVRDLMSDSAFVEQQQRRWADRLLYNNQAVSIERIFDMDRLVAKLYRGQVPYDQFAAVASAHPVLTRRKATPGDRAEAIFTLFLGRPPFENERSDLARLYSLWENGYYDHPALGMRLPDAVVRYRCIDKEGRPDPETKGECTSVMWGHNELVLTPDVRAQDGQMWSGLIRPEEWAKLQEPGRLLARQHGFWEHAVGQVVIELLGYDLGIRVPAVRERLVEHLLSHGGDIRAVYHAIATSQVYLQEAAGETPTAHQWTYGPLKQVEVETWIDTIKTTAGYKMSSCDHRVSQPEVFLREGGIGALAVVHSTRWEVNKEQTGVVGEYANLARTLGGCPENEIGGRFKTISILTTATQQSFVSRVCNPALEANSKSAVDVARLLPAGVDPKAALEPELAAQIFAHQVGLFASRDATAAELEEARAAGAACAPKPCTAEAFARPACYALLSSSEVLFY